jgi:hypothetical protein
MYNGQLKKGVCEAAMACKSEAEQTLTLQHGNIWMCDDCRAYEAKLAKAIQVTNQTILDSRKIDESILIKQDIYNINTVSLPEIKAAIQADGSIPESDKDLVYTQEVEKRYNHQTEVVFGLKAQLMEAENIQKVWKVATQEAASVLRAEQRILFAKIDANYQPIIKTIKSTRSGSPKSTKSTQSGQPTKKELRNMINAAAEKYNVPMSGLAMMVETNKGKSVDELAQKLKSMMPSASTTAE